MASSTKGKYRSAVTGRYVKKRHGKAHPKTTVKETDSGSKRRKK